ncbi:CDP-alcohol phosphatidyltransferase family protein [Longimicrobium sp.]|uniref:CDP-alcohol phosphatidyltransferase family protein n=1 Tax=Longimicrobium sp. TaxID=2029185 RepID=UPI002BD8E214|nr:CDP-alcohol phosphatidyltransferase family protein [Longimicrobium sp.]HSU12968.1 CDP-alcohol phosphatidyltransferase family protein [Longimicrobium sp.]
MSTRESPPPRSASAPRGRLAALRRNLSTVPNQLTAARLAMVPLLWVLVLFGHPVWVGIGVMVAAATDVLDGYLSRRWNQTSEFGSRMDSAADHLLAISMTLWLVLLRPFFFREQRWPLIAWAAFALLVLAVSWLKFRRAVDLHLYSSKAAVFLAWCFGIPLLVVGRYSRLQFWITITICFLAAAESLVVILTRREVDEHIGSILLRRSSSPDDERHGITRRKRR